MVVRKLHHGGRDVGVFDEHGGLHPSPHSVVEPSARICHGVSQLVNDNVKEQMAQRRIYIRVFRQGPSLEEQREYLQAAGVDLGRPSARLFVDDEGHAADADLPERDRLLKCLKPGDEIAIAGAAIIARDRIDLEAVIAEVGRRGARIFDASVGQVLEWSAGGQAWLEFGLRFEAEKLSVRMRMARKTPAAGKPRIFVDEAKRAKAEKLWKDPTLSIGEVVKLLGVGVSTLQREFGNRGTRREPDKAALARAAELWEDPSIPTAEIARRVGISRSTLLRHLPPRPHGI